MELSRSLAGNVADQGQLRDHAAGRGGRPGDRRGCNPFNPCLPDRYSRTCPRHPTIGAGYPPFEPQWKKYVLN